LPGFKAKVALAAIKNDKTLAELAEQPAVWRYCPSVVHRRIGPLRDDLWDVLHGLQVNRKRVRRLMRLMGIRALYPAR